MFKSRRMRLDGRVTCMEDMKNLCKILAGNLKERNMGTDGKVIIRMDLKEIVVIVWTGFNWLTIGPSG
jgi:hypothetical protein